MFLLWLTRILNIIRLPTLSTSTNEFEVAFYKKYPWIKGMDMSNLLIAGGAVGNIINKGYKNTTSSYTKRGYMDSDIDFFIYGLTTEEANKRVRQWIREIIIGYDYYKRNKIYYFKKKESEEEGESEEEEKEYFFKCNFKCKLARNNNMIFVEIGNYRFQIILRLYKTISEILHKFDLGSSSVGYDGKSVYLTTLGKFCYEHMCNVVDISKKDLCYEVRLEKYFKRGFNIVLPHFNIEIMKRDYHKYELAEVCELPYFIFSYTSIVGNKIMVGKFYNIYEVENDYKDLNDVHGRYKVNLKSMIMDDNFFYSRSEDRNVNRIEILRKGPDLTKGGIISFYEDLSSRLKSSTIDTVLIKEYITVVDVKTALSAMFDPDNDRNKVVDDIIKKQVAVALDKFEKISKRDFTKIDWDETKFSSQSTASFNPSEVKEDEWYGKFYKK